MLNTDLFYMQLIGLVSELQQLVSQYNIVTARPIHNHSDFIFSSTRYDIGLAQR